LFNRVMPAGLLMAVEASSALAATPAFAVPTSGVPRSYNQSPAPQAGVENKQQSNKAMDMCR
jgi:hypothetical protein